MTRHAARFALLGVTVLMACDRERRSFRDMPPAATPTSLVSLSTLEPGMPRPRVTRSAPYDDNAYAVAEGKRLYSQWNCVGCHAHGGGGIGPALMDVEWIYGSEPENIYATIVEGRPNGMPSFRGRLASAQVWQLVSYVRSLSGFLNADVRSGRPDHMQVRTQDQALKGLRPKRGSIPPPGSLP